MKYFLIAGEASGDLHGANLIKAIKKTDKNAEFEFWGGDLMKNAAEKPPLKHIEELAFMGFTEVLMNIRTILKNFGICKKSIDSFKPSVLVLIDYPGFNLRMAKWAKRQDIKIAYYISPQVWAWKEKRAHKIKKYVDRLICILPFEVDFYKKYHMEVDYVGHPLLDQIEHIEEQRINNSIIALIPGSRKQEISKMLPTMLKVAANFKNETFVVTGAPSIPDAFYNSFSLPENVKVVYNKTYSVMKSAKAALVTSGTATLETALFNTPEVVCYKGSSISVAIAKRLIKVKYISLVNLIMDKELVKELIQEEFTVANCTIELNKLLNPENSEKLRNGFAELKAILGNKGASQKTARIIYELAQSNI